MRIGHSEFKSKENCIRILRTLRFLQAPGTSNHCSVTRSVTSRRRGEEGVADQLSRQGVRLSRFRSHLTLKDSPRCR